MSWTPTFWIRKNDFIHLQDDLKSFEFRDNISAWEFEIAGHGGVVFGTPDTSHLARELHSLFESVPHWLLNSESEVCENCITWGDEIELEFL